MKKRYYQFAVAGGLAMCLVLSLCSASRAGFASVSDWTGLNNTSGGNNYVATPPSSAGGTFQERAAATSYLSDPSLVGSGVGLPNAFDFTEDLSISGTLSFTNPNNVDPNIFFGFYNSAGVTSVNTHRLGIAFADQAVNQFRAQMQAGNGAAAPTTLTMDTNGATAGGTAPLAAGTYAFSVTYTAATGAFAASVGPVSNSTTLPAGTFQVAGAADMLDRFGFLQIASSTTLTPFTLNVTNFNYTGETQVPEPTGLVLFCIGGVLIAARRR
jgi:hypothetical protein